MSIAIAEIRKKLAVAKNGKWSKTILQKSQLLREVLIP
jgi:hypothetical protein